MLQGSKDAAMSCMCIASYRTRLCLREKLSRLKYDFAGKLIVEHDGVSGLTKAALESIGNAHIQDLEPFQAWVIISSKGAILFLRIFTGTTQASQLLSYISATMPLSSLRSPHGQQL